MTVSSRPILPGRRKSQRFLKRNLRSQRAIWIALVIIFLITFLRYQAPRTLDPATILDRTKTALDSLTEPPNTKAESESGHPLATTKNGTYAGVHNSHEQIDYFWGLRYARAPVGALRYRKPAPLEDAWEGNRDASRVRDRCIGFESRNDHRGSEDCLILNIARPVLAREKKLPVLVYIHGGSFIAGSPTEQIVRPVTLLNNALDVGKPFILVSIQYRLSVLGFLWGKEMKEQGAGNLGLRDQRMALEWVKENIAGFGGDPKRVTIYGTSAGSISVGWHLLAHNGRDDALFRAAVMSSGSPQNYEPFRDVAWHELKFTQLLRETGCSSRSSRSSGLECLRSLDVARLAQVHRRMDLMTWKPHVDGDFLAGPPSRQLTAGKFVRVPVLVGVNTDEGLTWAFDGVRSINTAADLRAYLQDRSRENPRTGFSPSAVDRLLAAYPDDPCLGLPESLRCTRLRDTHHGAQFQRFGALATDLLFQAPRRHFCTALASAGARVYSYRFNANSPTRKVGDGVLHSDEKPFFWNHTGVLDSKKMPDSYYALTKLMSSSLAAFVSTGDPNGYEGRDGGVEAWPVYTVKERREMVFEADKRDGKVRSRVERDDFREEGIEVVIGTFGETGR